MASAALLIARHNLRAAVLEVLLCGLSSLACSESWQARLVISHIADSLVHAEIYWVIVLYINFIDVGMMPLRVGNCLPPPHATHA